MLWELFFFHISVPINVAEHPTHLEFFSELKQKKTNKTKNPALVDL